MNTIRRKLVLRKRVLNLGLFFINVCILLLTLVGAIPLVLGGVILFVGFLLSCLYIDYLLATWYRLYRESYNIGYGHGEQDAVNTVRRMHPSEYTEYLNELSKRV